MRTTPCTRTAGSRAVRTFLRPVRGDVSTMMIMRLLPPAILGVLLTLALLLLPNSIVDAGTMSNNMRTSAYGWPLTLRSTFVHTYRDGDTPSTILEERRSMHWGNILIVYSICTAICMTTFAAYERNKRKSANNRLNPTEGS